MQENKDKSISTTSLPKRLGWLIHIIAWSIILLLPFFFSGRNSESISWPDWPDYLRFVLNVIGVVIVFYINYFFLVKRFLFTKQRWQYILSNFILFIIIALVVHFFMELIPPPPMHNHPRGPKPEFFRLFFIFADCILYTFITGLSVAFKMTSSWYKVEAERKELEQSRSEAELQNLKSQLNPHFLFNTLNNIYSLIAISSDKAQEAVHELSRLLRYVLYESNSSFVTVDKDLDFVRNYVELMRIRLPEHVKLKTEINTTSPNTLIAPLLLITPIENAFKHGVSNNKPSFIEIEIEADEKQIICTIKNSYFPKDEQDKSGSGIGLVNLEKRLDLLYPDKYAFRCKQENEIYICELRIQLLRK